MNSDTNRYLAIAVPSRPATEGLNTICGKWLFVHDPASVSLARSSRSLQVASMAALAQSYLYKKVSDYFSLKAPS
ncbi:MAG TPA: hypothetical protein DCE52_08185 [Rhodobacteraceae bacterium]|nr:hypothetical protein [Paracoccaceae bacterium]